MDMQDLRRKDDAELHTELLRMRHSEFELRMQLRAGRLTRNHKIREMRHDIARVKTLMSERSRGKQT